MGYSIFDETMVDMTWPEIEESIRQKAIVLFPVGVIEEHGPHLGLAVDIYVSYLQCKMAKQDLDKKGIRTLIAPPLYWGINNLTGCFPGSFCSRPETLKAVLYDALASLRNWGVEYAFTINWHAEYRHNRAILEAVKEARRETGLKAYTCLAEYQSREFKLQGDEECILLHQIPVPPGSADNPPDLHAGALETGIMLNYFPNQVKSEIVRSLPSPGVTIADLTEAVKGRVETRKLIPGGYFGEPAKYNPETGKAYMEAKVRAIVESIEKAVSLAQDQ